MSTIHVDSVCEFGIIFQNTFTQPITEIWVLIDSTHTLLTKYIEFCSGNPLISDSLGPNSMGGHERYEGNCRVNYV